MDTSNLDCPSHTAKLVGATAGIEWDKLSKDVTYQVHTGDRWATVTRAIYATIQNPQNRRVLLKQEQKIINSELIKI